MNWLRFFRSMLLLPLILVLAVSPVMGEKILQISSGPWAPYTGEDLPHQGFVAHVITEAFAQEGYEVEFSFMPWVRAYNLMLEGDYDASAFWYESETRTKDSYYSDPVNTEKMVFFYKGENPIEGWEELTDLQDVKIGATRGLTYTDEFWELADKGVLNVYVTDDEYISFSQLIRGRIDVFISNVVVGKELLRSEFSEEEIAEIGYTENVVSEVSGHLLFPRGVDQSQEYLEIFNRGLAKIREESTYQRLYEQLLADKYAK